MNIPNNTNRNNRLIPGKRIFEKMYPLMEPRRQEKIVAGITSKKLFHKFGDNRWIESVKPSKEGCFGRSHIVPIPISTNGLKLVAKSI